MLPHVGGLRPVKPENIHLTLRFLGNTAVERIGPVLAVMESAAAGVAPFFLQTGDFGAFPTESRSRVVWLGFTGAREIARLYDDIERGLVQIGFDPEEKPFSPHITFARLKKPARVDLERVAGVSTGHRFKIEQITLFSSTLTSSGPIYDVVGEAELGGAGA